MQNRLSLRVEVISISKDAPGGLRQTLESVFAQTFPVHSVVVVYSGAGYESVLADFRSVIGIKQEGTGISSAFNAGMDFLSGDAVIFLNGGDVFESSNSLKILAERFSDDKPAVSGYARDVVSGSSIPAKICLLYFPAGYFYVSHQGTLYNRSHIGSIRYPADIRLRMDLAFNARVFSTTRPTIVDQIVVLSESGGITSRWSSLGLSMKEEARILIGHKKYAALLMVFVVTGARIAKAMLLRIKNVVARKK